MSKCMFVGCDYEPVSQCFTDQKTTLLTCFQHERELVDRYGVDDVMPRSILHVKDMTPERARAILSDEGYYIW